MHKILCESGVWTHAICSSLVLYLLQVGGEYEYRIWYIMMYSVGSIKHQDSRGEIRSRGVVHISAMFTGRVPVILYSDLVDLRYFLPIHVVVNQNLMCTLASPALRALLTSQTSHAYRINTRHSILSSKRHFLGTRRLLNPDDPKKGAASESGYVNEETTTSEDNTDTAQGPEDDIDNGDGSQAPSRPRDLSGYGSAARRAGRHLKKPKELPQFSLPPWFFERNVFLREELSKLAFPSEILELGADPTARSALTIAADCEKAEGIPREVEQESQKRKKFHEIKSPVRSYDINENVLREISSLVRIGLGSSIGNNPETWMSSKADLLLYHSKSGGSFYLDELVTRLAATHGADLIRLDPQDIADIGGSYVDDRYDTHVKSLSTLGYDVYTQTLTRASLGDEPYAEEASEEDDAGEGEEENDERTQHNPSRFGSSLINIIPISQLGENLMNTVHSAIATSPDLFNDQKPPSRLTLYGQLVDSTYQLKISSFLENTLNASEKKREINRTIEKHKSSGTESTRAIQEVITDVINDPKESTDAKSTTETLIVMVKDYVEIQSVSAGRKLIAQLHEIVKNRRKDGQKIIIIGTSSSEDLMQGLSRASLKKTESEPRAGPVRTILTPCHSLRSQDLTEDHRLKVALTNLRNIQDMLRRLSSHPKAIDRLSVQNIVFHISSESRVTDASRMESMETMLRRELGSAQIFHKITRYVWSLDVVHHVATIALGLNISLESSAEDSQVSLRHVLDATRLLYRSQAAKYKWMEDRREEGQERVKSTDRPLPGSFQQTFGSWSTSDRDSRMKKLRKICNRHEKRLLGGVVDPLSIRTTFADVRAPPETIDALKNLTSLSLLRPEAFRYGILATDKIPGLLLYGPPGTGKSLLARATAKESRATVLEVSGAGL